MAASGSSPPEGANPEDAPRTDARADSMPGCGAWQKTPLLIAARHGQVDVIDRALETSCTQPQLDVVDEKGNTALMVAAMEGHGKVVLKLLEAGCDLDVENLEGKKAVDLATTDEIRKSIEVADARVQLILAAVLQGKPPPGGSASFGKATGSGSCLPAPWSPVLAMGAAAGRSSAECPF